MIFSPISVSGIYLIIICVFLIISGISTFYHDIDYSRISRLRKIKDTKLQLSAVIQNADLTPAIDKYVKFPSLNIDSEKYTLTARGPSPNGRDPFGLVADDLQPLSDYVKDLVASENPVLTMAASHFFDQVFYTSLISLYILDVLLFRDKGNDSGRQ